VSFCCFLNNNICEVVHYSNISPAKVFQIYHHKIVVQTAGKCCDYRNYCDLGTIRRTSETSSKISHVLNIQEYLGSTKCQTEI
jgi:hypothetical protein